MPPEGPHYHPAYSWAPPIFARRVRDTQPETGLSIGQIDVSHRRFVRMVLFFATAAGASGAAAQAIRRKPSLAECASHEANLELFHF